MQLISGNIRCHLLLAMMAFLERNKIYWADLIRQCSPKYGQTKNALVSVSLSLGIYIIKIYIPNQFLFADILSANILFSRRCLFFSGIRIDFPNLQIVPNA